MSNLKNIISYGFVKDIVYFLSMIWRKPNKIFEKFQRHSVYGWYFIN